MVSEKLVFKTDELFLNGKKTTKRAKKYNE